MLQKILSEEDVQWLPDQPDPLVKRWDQSVKFNKSEARLFLQKEKVMKQHCGYMPPIVPITCSL